MRRDQESLKTTENNRAAWIVAAAGLPPGSELHAQDISPVMTALSKYMSAARDRALPETFDNACPRR